MKRKTVKACFCAALMTLALSVTACGDSDDAAKTTVEIEANGADIEDEAEPETEDETEKMSEAEDEAELETKDETEEVPEAEDKIEDETEAAPETGDEAEDDTAAAGAALEDYFSDPAVMSMMEKQYAALSGQGMEASIDVKGNDFTVIIKIMDASLIDETTGEKLSAGLDAAEAQLIASVEQFDEVIGEEGACTVTMRYLDSDGNVLAEKSCSAK